MLLDPEIRANAVNWIATNVIAKNKNLRNQSLKDFPNDKGYKAAANDMVDSILATGKTEGKDPLSILKFIVKKLCRENNINF